MQKHYPCILLTQDEVTSACGNPAIFANGYVTNRNIREKLEDYLGVPIVSIRQDSRSDSKEILVIHADGYVQSNPLTGKRIVALYGSADTLPNVLSDIFAERKDEKPLDIFDAYSYLCPIQNQIAMRDWVKNTYK